MTQTTLLSKINRGIKPKPLLATIYGLPGVGKTTFASQFPKPLFLDLEKGSLALDVERITDIPSYSAFIEYVQAISKDNHDYKTLVVDSLEALESLMFTHLCEEDAVDSIEKYDGGFGKGFSKSKELFRNFMMQMQALTELRGMDVVLIGHSQQKTFTDPAENTQYDRFTMRLAPKNAEPVRELSDALFFAKHKVTTMKDQGKVKAFSNGESVLCTKWNHAFDAKNRLMLPKELPLQYTALIQAIENAKPATPEELREEINDLSKGLDQDTAKIVATRTSEATTVQELTDIKNRVLEIIKTQAA